MTTTFFSLEQMAAVYKVEQDWLFEKLLAWHALIRTRHTCTLAIIENAMNDLIHHFDYHFYKIAESLTPKQLSFLKALMEGNQKLYYKATRDKYQLGSTSNWDQPATLHELNKVLKERKL